MSASTAPGSLRLDVIDDDTIQDGAGNPLGGPGAGNGDFTNRNKSHPFALLTC